MNPLLTVVFTVASLVCLSQRNSDSLYFANMKSRKIEVSVKQQKVIANLPFNKIQVWDVRPDTSTIGFLKFGNSNTKRLYFDAGLANTFNNFVINNYKLSNDTNNLLILIKELRISNYATKRKTEDINVSGWNAGAVISAELFLSNESNYRALYKVDSILVETSPTETVEELVIESFKIILKKVQDKKISEIHIGKTAFSFSDLQKHINDYTNFPILKNTILNKGVYRNFIEFRINNPSIKEFEVRKGKLSDELFVTENNQSFPLQNFWGYSDGKNVFIYSAKNLFQLFRSENTYNMKGIKSFKTRETLIKDTTTYLLGNLIFTGRQSNDYLNNGEFNMKITAFQLNMQNGELY